MLVSLSLLTLTGAAALAIDIGQLWTIRRVMQTAADAGALAGADAIAAQASASDIISAAKGAATQNGFTDGSGSATSPNKVSVSVSNPPSSGSYANNSEALQVVITQVQPTYFMQVLGQSSVPVSATAVALTVSGGSCIYTLDPSAPAAITVAGGGNLNSSCGIYDNSNSSTALTVSGGGVITAPLVGVVGGTSINGGGNSPPSTGIAAFGDPLAWVQAPPVGSCTSYSSNIINSSTTLNPGLYCGGIKINSGATVNLNSGTYVLNGGGLTVLSGATVSGTGVSFYLTGVNKPSSDPSAYSGVNIAGSSNVNLSAPCTSGTGGIVGMLFFQDRSITSGTQSVINGGSTSTFSGGIYFPTTALSYSGSSGTNGYTELVSDTLSINGAANVGNNYSCLANGSLIRQAALAQ